MWRGDSSGDVGNPTMKWSNHFFQIKQTFTVSCFADDTRILLGIKDEEDTQMLQNDLHKLYKWADTK